MKKDFSPYATFSLEKIDSPKNKKKNLSAVKIKTEKDLRFSGRTK